MSFGPKGRLEKARAEDSVEFKQGTASKSQEIHAGAVDVFLHDGRLIEKAITSAGPAQIVLNEKETKSTIGADEFEAKFGEQNHVHSVFGSGNARIVSTTPVSTTPGHPDRVTTSRDVSAIFNNNGAIVSAEQTGDFRYQEGERRGWAERARYDPGDETFTLTGSPRFSDSIRSLTADSIKMSRRDSSALAQGHVKSTYNQIAQLNGGMLGGADPLHVTGATMTFNRNPGTARYTAARLWRGQQTVEAPVIFFDNANRSLKAESDAAARVASVFVQPAKNGKQTPVNVTSDKLSYVDATRKALFTGNVLVGIEGGTINADTVQALIRARDVQNDGQSAGQLDRIVAQGDIRIKQPNREATGSQLVYIAAEEKFVLTGTAAQPPSIFDTERGQISGDSLTFFSHDGRVLVGSGAFSQSQTQTKVHDASKK
jgi:lipopolysaccharide transport protein LptA